ncbi:MAG: hypothetical protein DWQ07_08275 [Chloroflexi bacterium]|nr:MAG: hypothetical protein DWQ07_08275 [Chloroflexota bacterium]MBL1193293.1 hypothetical protein [Chloroflexota bacterium]NOH10585.1 hypothetical protein [Chloroflexota bacterium]
MTWSITYLLTEFKPAVVKKLCLNESIARNLYSVAGEVDLLFAKDVGEFWNQVEGSAEVELDIDELKPPTVIAAEDFNGLLKMPPRDFRSYLKGLAQFGTQPVCLYCHETWAGVTEYENAWVFVDGKEYLYFFDSEAEDSAIYRNENSVWVQIETNKTVLQLMLEYLGFEAPDKDFPPHTREFDWANHRVQCSEIGKSNSDA